MFCYKASVKGLLQSVKQCAVILMLICSISVLTSCANHDDPTVPYATETMTPAPPAEPEPAPPEETALEELVFEVYDDIFDGLRAVMQDGLWGYVDEAWNVVIPLMYDDRGAFSGGVAPVKQGDFWGVIDQQNNVVVNFQFDRVHSFAGVTTDPFMFRNNRIGVSINNAAGVIDQTGHFIVPLNQEYEPGREILEGYAYPRFSPRFFGEDFIMIYIRGGQDRTRIRHILCVNGTLVREIDRSRRVLSALEGGSLLIFDDVNGELKAINSKNETVASFFQVPDRSHSQLWPSGLDDRRCLGNVGTWDEWMSLQKSGEREQGWRLNYINLTTGQLLSDDWFECAGFWIGARQWPYYRNYLMAPLGDVTHVYATNGQRVYTVDGRGYGWFNGLFHRMLSADGTTHTITDIYSGNVLHTFGAFNRVNMGEHALPFDVAIVLDTRRIMQGLFIDTELVYDTIYHEVSWDSETGSFILQQGNTQIRVTIDSDGSVTEEVIS